MKTASNKTMANIIYIIAQDRNADLQRPTYSYHVVKIYLIQGIEHFPNLDCLLMRKESNYKVLELYYKCNRHTSFAVDPRE